MCKSEHLHNKSGIQRCFGTEAGATSAHALVRQVNLQQFANFFDLPVNEHIEKVFNAYDQEGVGSIDFREYLIGHALVSRPAAIDETIRLAFQVCRLTLSTASCGTHRCFADV